MTDDKNEGDPEDHGEGDEKDENPKQKPTGDAGNVEELKKKLEEMSGVLKAQQAIIDKFQKLGQESPPAKTEAERVAELEATLAIVTQKIESDKQVQAEAERRKREAVIDTLIREQPAFKDQRELLLKVDESVLELLTKTKGPETNSPVTRIGAMTGIDWNKKIAAAAERRKQRTDALNAVKY